MSSEPLTYEALIGFIVALMAIIGGVTGIGWRIINRIDKTKEELRKELTVLDDKMRKNVADVHKRIDIIEKDGVSREELMVHVKMIETSVHQGMTELRERIDDIYKLLFEAVKKGSN